MNNVNRTGDPNSTEGIRSPAYSEKSAPKITNFGSRDFTFGLDIFELANKTDNPQELTDAWFEFRKQATEAFFEDRRKRPPPSSYVQIRLDRSWKTQSKVILNLLHFREQIEDQLNLNIQKLAELSGGMNCIGGSLALVQHIQLLVDPNPLIVQGGTE